MTYFRRFFISGIRIHIPLADPHYGRLLLFPWISLTVRGGSLAWFPLLLSVDAKLRSVLADFSPITETQWSGTLGDIPAIIWAYRPDWRFLEQFSIFYVCPRYHCTYIQYSMSVLWIIYQTLILIPQSSSLRSICTGMKYEKYWKVFLAPPNTRQPMKNDDICLFL